MKFNPLTLKDKNLFRRFLAQEHHELSVYAFENILIWKTLFDIKWQIISSCLCVFFKDVFGEFLYLPPLGEKGKEEALRICLEIMDRANSNKEVSRIENIEENQVDFYRRLGLDCREKSRDYISLRSDLVNLVGDKFKSKRASYNYFRKNFEFKYLEFSKKDKKECLELYKRWMRERATQNQDSLYLGMLEDSRKCLEFALDNFAHLELSGRVVKIKNKVQAFTLGFPLNKDTFCIFYEIADLSIKGLAQFIFREFCQELKNYRYINVMDDSGLENLKKVKLSYHPVKLIPAYIAKRKNAPRPS